MGARVEKRGNRAGHRGAGATTLAQVAIGLALANAVAPRAHAQEQAQPPRPPTQELTEQQRLRSQSPGGPLTTGVELPRWPEQPNALASTTLVTDEMLANPSPNDWLTWRRTHDGLGFSPLTQIDKNNVSGLQLAWSLALPPGPNTATPLVHDGVIYVHSFGDHVQALDAKTGDELWHYARTLPSTARPTVKRNMALYGDKIYFGTSDVHVVALDARTGAVVWDMPITEPGSGFGLSGGPLVARGKVMQGVNGQAPGGAYIVALDAETRCRSLAFLHDRAARRARRRELERPAARAAHGRLGLDGRQLRRGAQSRVLRPGPDLRYGAVARRRLRSAASRMRRSTRMRRLR